LSVDGAGSSLGVQLRANTLQPSSAAGR
jgi:hypothetical protein